MIDITFVMNTIYRNLEWLILMDRPFRGAIVAELVYAVVFKTTAS